MPEKELLNMASNSSQIECIGGIDGEANDNSDNENSNAKVAESELKKKRHNRHTQEQIQEMEALFKECPHPNRKQRTELSQALGMEPLQVKFWFQNKKTQIKTHHKHKENNQLRTENEKLRAENLRFKEAIDNASCFHCGLPIPVKGTSFDEHQLKLQNSRLRQEINHMSSIFTNVGRTIPTSMKNPSSTPHFGSGIYRPISADLQGSMNNERRNEENRLVGVDIAMSAMEELMRVALLGEPLWLPSIDCNSFELNEEEYLRAFSRVSWKKTNGFHFEASRESVVVPMCATTLAEILMDVEQWASIFSGVVSRAVNLQIISSGLNGTCNEAVFVMKAEFHVSSLLVSTRESNFLRYCKRHVHGIWAVVDVSLDHLNTTSSLTCRRRPSGCLIQDITSGHSKVIWVEHVEVEDGGIDSIYKPLVTSGLAFGAKRWVAILEGYCQRVIQTLSTGVPLENADNTLVEDQEGRKNMLRLAERMVTRFCCGVNTSIVNTWTTLSGKGNERVKFMRRTNVDDPSMPFGVLYSIATSFWLPIPPTRVFGFLCDNSTRKVWDMLLNGGDVDELAHIVCGKEELNRVTLYRIKGSESNSGEMIMLQESRSDPTACYVVYAPINMVCASAILGGEDQRNVPILPSGFAILPDGPTGRGQGRGMKTQVDTGGSLLTVALQILIDSNPNANPSTESLAIASKLMCSTVNNIKQALIPKS